MDVLPVINEAVHSSTLPVEVIADHARMRTKDLDSILEGAQDIEVYAAGRIFAAAGGHPAVIISPADLNALVNPLSQPRSAPPRRGPRAPEGRVSMVDIHRSTAQGRADIDGMLFSMQVTSICHNLINHLFKDKYENDSDGFDREQAHWSDLFEGARDASFEDLHTLTSMAGGTAHLILVKDD